MKEGEGGMKNEIRKKKNQKEIGKLTPNKPWGMDYTCVWLQIEWLMN